MSLEANLIGAKKKQERSGETPGRAEFGAKG